MVEIRLLTAQDAGQFRELRLKSLKEDPYSWLSSIKEEEYLPLSAFSNRIYFAFTQPIFGYYGYFDNTKLLGYAQISPSSWNKKKHIITLYDVCVNKERRRKSIGKSLIKHIVSQAKSVSGIEKIQLWVTSKNEGAIAFYESLGFKKTTVTPESVREENGEYQDEYLYSLRLK